MLVFAREHNFLFHCILAAILLLVVWILTRVTHRVFRELQKKQPGIHLFFFERVASATLLIGGIILCCSIFGGIGSIWRTLLGGTAIISAVLAFAAQDVIKDILAGLMISLYKPFEIGNRIMLEDGTAGIVKDITMRHVVLVLVDTQYLVIPNSRLNVQSIRNFSYHVDTRSAAFSFQIAYGSDVEQAMRVIREAVMESPYTIPGKPTEQGMAYAPIYFMAYRDSSLELRTTAYYEATNPSEVVISDVNLRVSKALAQNGIEIPYTYINVVQKQEDNAKQGNEQ